MSRRVDLRTVLLCCCVACCDAGSAGVSVNLRIVASWHAVWPKGFERLCGTVAHSVSHDCMKGDWPVCRATDLLTALLAQHSHNHNQRLPQPERHQCCIHATLPDHVPVRFALTLF